MICESFTIEKDLTDILTTIKPMLTIKKNVKIVTRNVTTNTVELMKNTARPQELKFLS